jgi:hypothetical protein
MPYCSSNISQKSVSNFVLKIVFIFTQHTSRITKPFRFQSSDMLHCAVMLVNTSISEEYAVSIFKVEMFIGIAGPIIRTLKTKAICFSKLQTCTSKATQCHKWEYLLLETQKF